MDYFNKIMHPEYFQGDGQSRNYFEGWYFRAVSKNLIFSLIPGLSVADGHSHAFIQLIILTENRYESRYFKFSVDEFFADNGKFKIVIKNNVFSAEGINVNLKQDDFEFSCNIQFGEFTSLKKHVYRPNIMGIFSYFPNMECSHGVISLRHTVSGTVELNGDMKAIFHGIGYIEKDWGTSFPQKYLWLQCNNFGRAKVSLMLAVAVIPHKKQEFQGLICALRISDKEYVLSTYNFAAAEAIIRDGKDFTIKIKKAGYRLTVTVTPQNSLRLSAPVNGEMQRAVDENIDCNIYLDFERNKKKIFEGLGENAAFEISGY